MLYFRNISESRVRIQALASGSRKSQPPMITNKNGVDSSRNDDYSTNSQSNLHFSLTSGGGGGASGMHGNTRVVPINRNAGKKGETKEKVIVQETGIFFKVSYNLYGK